MLLCGEMVSQEALNLFFLVRIQAEQFGIVAESAYATDLKSVDHLILWVQVPPISLTWRGSPMAEAADSKPA